LSRNRIIHALTAKLFIAQCTLERGGTWQGTLENLRHGWSSVFCCDDGSEAVRQLVQRGAVAIRHTDLRNLDALQNPSLTFFDFDTEYPKHEKIAIRIGLQTSERFKIKIRNPYWSKKTKISVKDHFAQANEGYIEIEREWKNGDMIALTLDMRTQAIYPTPYGSQILMNKIIWEKDITIPCFDKEDPIAKNHVALRYGPIMLAQDNRLGYSVDDPVCVAIHTDGYVDALLFKEKKASFDTIVEAGIPLSNGTYMPVVDYASAGKLWTEKSKMAVWILSC
jgi:hypothetical protein